MPRLYFRIYLAVLASLLVFGVAVGTLWRTVGNPPSWSAREIVSQLAQNVLPVASEPAAEQQLALEKIGADLGVDISIFAADRSVLASVGAGISPLAPKNEPPLTSIQRDGSIWLVSLKDGRVLAARLRPAEQNSSGASGLAFIGMLLLLFVVVAIAAHPVVRRITRRLERLQAGVDMLERGDLSARVAVEGRDEIAELATSFNRAAARIETLVNAHKMLLANASHELRTPLTRIRMGVELLKGEVDSKRKAEIGRDIAELDELIDGILLTSRLEALTETQVKEEVDLLALAAEECARYEDCQLIGETAVVVGDPRLLRRMIRNLLDNATRHGAAPIDVSVRRVGVKTELSVTDHGPGILESDRESVFEPFRRASGKETTQGAGLGLALVRRIARHHGGDVRIGPRDRPGFSVIVTM